MGFLAPPPPPSPLASRNCATAAGVPPSETKPASTSFLMAFSPEDAELNISSALAGARLCTPPFDDDASAPVALLLPFLAAALRLESSSQTGPRDENPLLVRSVGLLGAEAEGISGQPAVGHGAASERKQPVSQETPRKGRANELANELQVCLTFLTFNEIVSVSQQYCSSAGGVVVPRVEYVM